MKWLQLESAERARKAAESELHEASDRVSELSTQAASLSGAKRKLETDVQAMQVKPSYHIYVYHIYIYIHILTAYT